MESTYRRRTQEAKKQRFRAGFPDKADVKTRITVALNGSSTLGQLKTNLEKMFNGDGATPGIVDALFDLDR